MAQQMMGHSLFAPGLLFVGGSTLAIVNRKRDDSSLLFYLGVGAAGVGGFRIARGHIPHHYKFRYPQGFRPHEMHGEWHSFKQDLMSAFGPPTKNKSQLKFTVLNSRKIFETRGAKRAVRRAIRDMRTPEEVEADLKAEEMEQKQQQKEAWKKQKHHQAFGWKKAEKPKEKESEEVPEEDEFEQMWTPWSKQKRDDIDKWQLPEDRGITYVFDYQPFKAANQQKGGLRLSNMEKFQYIANTLAQIVRPGKDEVVLRLNSPGGSAQKYGYLASILKERFRDRNVPLTCCIDQVGASGGYMMAATANTIVAAPTAAVGSIGVRAEFPNFNKKMKDHNIDWLEFQAGELKRNVSVMGEVNQKQKDHLQVKLLDTHRQFVNFVAECRGDKIKNLPLVSTGDVWSAQQAKDLGLVDQLGTSDALIQRKIDDHRLVIQVSFGQSPYWPWDMFERTAMSVAESVSTAVTTAVVDRVASGAVLKQAGECESSVQLKDSTVENIQAKATI